MLPPLPESHVGLVTTSPARLRIETLGRCAAVIGDRRIESGAQMMLAVLLMLGLERGTAWPRAEIAEILWPAAPSSTRAGRLRWLLAKLRTLGLAIQNNSGDIMLDAEHVDLDIDDIAHIAPESVGQILPLRSTELPATFLSWLDQQRMRLRAGLAAHLRSRLHLAVTHQHWPQAKAAAAAILRLDPRDEAAPLALAESLFRLGAKSEAVATLERHLTESADRAPDLQLQADLLLRRIRSIDAFGERGVEPRFVGRVEELRRIDGLLHDARNSQGSALVLTGTAGIGKTRLLDEARSRALMAGMQVVRVRCQRGDARRPLSGLADFVPQLLDLRGAAGCRPDHLARLRTLADPPLADGSNDPARADSRPDPQVQRSRLTQALIDLLDAVASEAPLLLQVDDAQWADKSLKWLWDDVLAFSQSLPVAWLFAFRTARNEAPALPIPIVQIGSLELAFAEELVADLARLTGHSADLATRRAILSRGAGSPLFIRELVRQWEATGSSDSLPTSLRGVIDRGLAGVGKRALRLLQVAAVLGTNATLDRVEQICGFARAAFIDALVELEARGILTADQQGQTFGHVLWAEAALGQLSPTITALLHRSAAEQLERELEARPVASLLWETARHWELARQPERALAAIVRGAEHLFDNGFPADAVAAYARAEHMTQDARRKLTLLRRRLDHLDAAGAFTDLIAEIDRHENLASELDVEYNRHNDLELLRISAHVSSSSFPGDWVEPAMRCLRNAENDAPHRLGAGRHAAIVADLVAPALLYEINDLVLQIPVETPGANWNRLRARWVFERRFGDIAALPSICDQFLAIAREENDLSRVRALHIVGESSVILGRFAEARAAFGEAAQLAYRRGFSQQVLVNHDHLIGMSLEVDPPDVTRRLLDDITRVWNGERGVPGWMPITAYLARHECNLAAKEGRFEEALSLVRALEECLAERIPRWRVRYLAMHLAARIGLGRMDDVHEIARGMTAAFEFPDDWLDWPATVYADYLERFVGVDAAREFAVRYVHTIRRELYPAPARLRMLAGQPA